MLKQQSMLNEGGGEGSPMNGSASPSMFRSQSGHTHDVIGPSQTRSSVWLIDRINSVKRRMSGQPLPRPSKLEEDEEEEDLDDHWIGEGRWVSEHVLWLDSWRHVGTLTARRPTELVALNAHIFQ